MSLLDFVPSINYDFRLTKKELFRFKRVFDAFDADMRGTISCIHLGTALRACALNISNKEVKKVMEQEGWQPTTQIGLSAFFILIARLMRGLSTSLGPAYLEVGAAQVKRAFCSLYIDTGPHTKSEEKDPYKKLEKPKESALRFKIPTEILREKLVDRGPEPLPPNLYDRFRLEMPADCLGDEGRSFDALALFEFCNKACVLEDADDHEEKQRKQREQGAGETLSEKALSSREQLQGQGQDATKQTKYTHDHRDGWKLPGELLGNMSNVAHKTTAKLDKYSRDLKKTVVAGLENFVPRELREEIRDGFGEMTKQAGEYAGMVGLGLGSDGEDGKGDDTNYEELFPELERHATQSDATTSSSSGSLSKDHFDDGDDDSSGSGSRGSRNGRARASLYGRGKDEGIDEANFDEMFIVDDKTKKTVEDNLAAGDIEHVQKILKTNRRSSGHNWTLGSKKDSRKAVKFPGALNLPDADYQRQGLVTRSEDEEEDVGYMGNSTRLLVESSKSSRYKSSEKSSR